MYVLTQTSGDNRGFASGTDVINHRSTHTHDAVRRERSRGRERGSVCAEGRELSAELISLMTDLHTHKRKKREKRTTHTHAHTESEREVRHQSHIYAHTHMML